MKQILKNLLFKKRIKILKSTKGFSLLEVLIAVGIIAIISAIAVPQYTANKKEAAKVAGDTSINNIEKAYKHCIALGSHGDCDTLSEIKVSCQECSESVDSGGTKFCAHIEKTSGGAFRACIEFESGKTVGRSYGGSLLEDINICHDDVTGCTDTNKNKKYPQKGAKTCVNATDCQKGTFTCAGSPAVTASCDPINTAGGKCVSGACTRS